MAMASLPVFYHGGKMPAAQDCVNRLPRLANEAGETDWRESETCHGCGAAREPAQAAGATHKALSTSDGCMSEKHSADVDARRQDDGWPTGSSH